MRWMLAFFLLVAAVRAEAVTIDPDQFPDGTNISEAFPGVSLRLEDRIPGSPNVGNYIWSMEGLSSTGDRSFAWRVEALDPLGELCGSFDCGMLLSVEFGTDVSSVWIDVVQDNLGNTRGWLATYDSRHDLIEEVVTPVLSGPGDWETVEIHRPISEIRYVLAGSNSIDGVRLDNLRHSTHVPEPSILAFCLALCGAVGIWLVFYALGRTRR